MKKNMKVEKLEDAGCRIIYGMDYTKVLLNFVL